MSQFPQAATPFFRPTSFFAARPRRARCCVAHKMPGTRFTAGDPYVFAWGAGEDGQLGLEEAQVGEDDWNIGIPTVRLSSA